MSGNITRDPRHDPARTAGGTVCGAPGKIRSRDGKTTCLRCMMRRQRGFGRTVSRKFNFPVGKAASAPTVVKP